MGSSAKQEYCSFTKAVEHLGDRWSLLIVRELAMFGPAGFNALANGLPGRVSRSVLASRLKKLEEIGLLARSGTPDRGAPYRLTPAGEQLVPTLHSLWEWAERWVPEDPAMSQRDPTVILWWLTHRVDAGAAPPHRVAIEFALHQAEAERVWLLIGPDAEPELCLTDPGIAEAQYVFVEADAAALFPVARGLRSWSDAIADGSVRLYGDPSLVRSLPGWFLGPSAAPPARPARERHPVAASAR